MCRNHSDTLFTVQNYELYFTHQNILQKNCHYDVKILKNGDYS